MTKAYGDSKPGLFQFTRELHRRCGERGLGAAFGQKKLSRVFADPRRHQGARIRSAARLRSDIVPAVNFAAAKQWGRREF
jgi:hypothetical protein